MAAQKQLIQLTKAAAGSKTNVDAADSGISWHLNYIGSNLQKAGLTELCGPSLKCELLWFSAGGAYTNVQIHTHSPQIQNAIICSTGYLVKQEVLHCFESNFM